MFSPRIIAILLASFVTLIWSFSWVLIKIGLEDMPPLTFAGLRYFLAFLCLLALSSSSPSVRVEFRALGRRGFARLAAMGIVLYAVAQGAQFAALIYLPAVTLSLFLNFIPLVVVVIGFYWLQERPSMMQLVGIGIFVMGVLLYFAPFEGVDLPIIGVLIGALCVVANAVANVFARDVNQAANISPMLITTVSMGVGSALLLVAGLLTEPFPALDGQSLLIVVWLAVVHTAFTFTVWNSTLRTLPAVESSVINNMMIIYIAVLAWLFLGEALTLQAIIALLIAFCGILMVQVMPHRKPLKGRVELREAR